MNAPRNLILAIIMIFIMLASIDKVRVAIIRHNMESQLTHLGRSVATTAVDKNSMRMGIPALESIDDTKAIAQALTNQTITYNGMPVEVKAYVVSQQPPLISLQATGTMRSWFFGLENLWSKGQSVTQEEFPITVHTVVLVQGK